MLGYTSQARFLMNCGLLDLLEGADIRTIANAQKLLTEHEMGELFKVIGFARRCDPAFTTSPIGFAHGDRTHTRRAPWACPWLPRAGGSCAAAREPT